MARLTYLDRDILEFIAHKLAANLFTDYGGPLPAFRLIPNIGAEMLESALGTPRQRYYPRLHDKAGALLRSLIKNHPLVDGNKRVALTATLAFLTTNGYVLLASNREMVDFALRIAAEKPDVTWQEVAGWLKKRTFKLTAATSPEEFQDALNKLPDEWHDAVAVRKRVRAYMKALEALRPSLTNMP